MKPANEGDSSITGYRIEWSADGTSDWQALEANHATRAGREIVTGYSDTGLGSETTRHYRVFAINDQGTGLGSNVEDTTTADIAEPVLQSATVNGVSLVLTYDEDLDEDSEPPADAFTVSVEGAARALATTDPVAVSGKTVTLTLATAADPGETVTLGYTVPTGTDAKPIRDEAENNAAALTNQAVTNNTAVNEVPAFTAGLVTTLSVAENSALETDVGSPFTATDADTADTLTYTLEGTDAGSFSITDKGQIQTNAHIDHEAKASRSVTVKVSDGKDAATLAVTVNVADEDDTGGDSSLTPSPDDPEVARKSQATYSVRMDGNWTDAVTPAGVPDGAHFTTFVGGIHNDQVAFLEAGETASAGIEAMAEAGATATLIEEVNDAKPNAARHITIPAPGIGSTSTQTDVVFTSDHPRLTLTSMIAPTPDWFVGVSGLSLLDSSGDWRDSVTVNLYPWDAGTEDGTGFSLTNDETDPQGVIASIRGRGQFTGARIARLVVTRTGTVQLAPAAPAGFALAPADGAVTLGWTVPAAAGITGHEYRQKAGDGYGAWTAIPDSAPSEANEDSFTVTGLSNGTLYTFQLRAVNAVGGGVSSAEVAATPNAPATGTVTITGTAEVGQTLTVSVSGVTDGDGVPSGVTYTYQWVRVDGTDETDIAGATSSTYALVAADQGKKVKVKVSFEDDVGNDEELSSAAYPSGTATVGVATTPPTMPTPGTAVWSAVLTVGGEGTDVGYDSVADFDKFGTLDDDDFDIDGTTYTVTRLHTGSDNEFTFEVRSGGSRRQLPNDDRLTLRLENKDSAGTYWEFPLGGNFEFSQYGTPYTANGVLPSGQASGETVNVQLIRTEAQGNAIGEPEISGTVAVGSTLTASPGTIEDPDGTGGASYSYQWLRVDADGSSNAVDIPGATSSTYTLTAADAGKRIRVEARFTDDEGNAEARLSDATVAVPAFIAIAPDRPKATGRFDAIVYTLERGPATEAAAVTVTLAPPAGNDWGISDSNLSHAVAFGAGEASKRLRILLRSSGSGNVGFSPTAATGGTLVASLGAVTGYDTTDTAEVEVVVTGNPSWIVRLTQPSYSFHEDGGAQTVTMEAYAASADMPAPSLPMVVNLRAYNGTAIETQDFSVFGNPDSTISTSAFAADAQGIQRGQLATSFEPLPDSAEEGSETLEFALVRRAAIPSGVVQYERPDGTRGDSTATYPVTIIDDDDTTMPMLSTATVDGASLVLTYNELLDEGSKPPPGAFTVTVDSGDGAEPSMVDVSGKTVTLTLAAAVTDRQTVTVSYTVPTEAGENPIRDGAQHPAAALTGQAVTNDTDDTTLPTLESATVDGDSLVLTYDEDLDEDSEPPADAFTVTVDSGDGAEPSMVDVSGKTVTLALAAAVTDRQTVTVSYTVPTEAGENPIRDGAQHPAAALAGQAVTNDTPDKTVPALSTATVNGASLVLTYDEDLDEDSEPPADAFTVTVDSGDGTEPSMVDVSGKAVTLTLASAVTDRQTVTVTYRVPMTGTDPKPIRDAAQNNVAALAGQKVTNESDDTTGPEYASANVAAAGTSLTIVFDETLDATEANLPAAARFAVTAGDGARFAVGSVTVAGKNVTLALASGTSVVRADQTVTLAYTDPNADGDDPRGVVQDDSGNDAADFTTGESGVGAVVNNSTEPVTAPDAPAGFEAEGADSDRIRLRWDAPADTGGREITGYRIEASEDDDPFSWTELAAGHNTMNDGRFEYTHLGLLLGEVRHYRVSARNGSLEADVGEASAVVKATTVHPGAPDAPTGLTATAGLPTPRDGTTLISLSWAKPTNEGESSITSYRIEWSADGTSDWQELVANHDTMAAGKIVTGYSDIGLGSETTRHYRVFAINDQGTGLGSSVVDTTTADIAPPTFVSASVAAAGTSLTIVFNETLDATEANLPAAARFAVTAGDGARFAVGSVTVAGKNVTLALASGTSVVRADQAVTLAYTDPNADGDDPRGVVQDDSGNDAADFTTGESGVGAVVNNSTEPVTAPDAPAGFEAEGAGDTSIVVTWDAPADTGGREITGYRVEVSTDGNPPWTELADNHNTMTGGRFEYIHMGLLLGEVRHYRVSARNGSLEADVGEASAVVKATTVHPGAPAAPTGLTATAGLPTPRDGTTLISLSWAKPTNEGESSITSYRIEWSADGTSDWQELVANHDTMAAGKIVTGYSDIGLGSETTRHYRVFAINDQGTGLGSSVVDTTTADIAPPTFVSASVAAAGTSLTIVFNETLDATEANLPAAARFAVTAVDGARFAVADVAVAGKNVTLALVSGTATVRAGQKVTLAYTDPNADDDDPKGVVQDDSGNDAADFTTGKSGVGAVVNNSTEPVTAPDAPAGFEAEGADSDRIRLRWDAPADTGGREITGYRIEASEDDDPFSWTELAAGHNTMNDGRFEYTHLGLLLGEVRHYRVSARNGSLEADVGEASAVVKATTVHPGAPAAPPALTATPGLPSPRDGTTLIRLGWSKPANEGESQITGYRIDYSADVDPLVWQELVADTGNRDRSHRDTGLPSETRRHYRVFAINDQGTGLGSSVADTTTADIAGPEYASASVAAGGTSLTIVFNETLDATEANLPAAARFAVTAGDGARFAVGSVTVAGKNVTLALASGTSVVRADQTVTLAYTDPNADGDDPRGVVQDDSGNDAADFTTGESGVGAVVNNSAEPVTAPDAPAGLEAEGAGGDRIRLRWDAPADTGGREITGYRIEASEDDDPFSWTELAGNHNTMTGGRFEYTHLGLSLGDVRHYRVSAINSAGTGTATAVVRGITVPPGAPDAPPGVTATADGGTAIDLAWDAPANTGDSAIRSYTIEWSPDGMTDWQLLRSIGPAARAHPDTDLSSETTRHYRIFAVNDEGSSAGSEVVSATTDDILGPEPQSATVAAAGTSIAIVFDEALADASASLPAPGAFTVRTGDGVQIAIDSVSVTDTVMTLSAASTSPTIKTGQTVTVTYTDPSAADDAAAIQDEADNDAASFTLGPGQTVTVTNGSTVAPTVPGAPTDLAVQGVGGDRIALTWTKPRDTGGRAISSYFIEVSEDGGTEFSELVPDHNTMVGGEIALRYLHTGLEATDVRHYRVSAKNSVGTGTASITAMGQPVEPIGRVDIAFDTPAATEGTALGWTVTATTLADEQPQSDFALRVAVASEADTAGDADYTRVAETVSFARSDFARRSVGGQMRWVAEKTGQVTTNDDVEVEATETFALTATVTNIVQSRFLTGTGRAEGSIEDNDTWTIEVIADPTSVAEGESRDVKLTARIAPASTECVVPFPVTVSLSATGTATSGTDYRLNGETNDQEIAPCTAETSWPVTMTSNVDTADDDGETVVFTPEIAGTPAIAPEPFQPATVTLRETRGVLLSALSLNAEEGRSTTYTMVLTSRPTGTVTVRPEVSGDMDVTVSPASLAFTPGDWNVRQTVKVHAAPDADEDDDAAEVSHQVSGADYGTNRVSAGSIAISVQDDDATFGELTVGVLVGDAHNSSAAAAPRVHFGEPFTIKLWWSEIRTREWEKPQLAIGADRAIRVTGADVMPVKDDMTDTWSRTSLRLKFTPHGTDDVTLVIEPLDCTRDEHGRYNRHAICGWVGSDRGGNTGLTERVRWTARGIAGAPAAPANVTVSPGHRVHREQYQVAFDAEPAATRYRVQIQDAGGSWSSPRTLTDDASGRREEVAIEGVSHAQDYDVRVRWENRFGESPWVTVHTSDTLAPPQPTGLTLTQDDDGHSVSLAWTPDTGGTTARYQYRVADEWTDIAQSGPGEANRRAYTVGGLSHTWKMEAQVRGVGPTGRTGEPSETAQVAYTPPHVMEARIRMASSPGSDGHYGVGDRMLVAVPMNRPVRRSGPLPTLDLQIGSTTHTLALSRREPSQLASGVVEVPETAVTLYFAHTVTKHDEDTDGVSIPANGLSLNAGQLLDATEDGNNRRATFTLSQPKHFAAHKVQGVHAEVERIEWLENRVWVHYNRDLAPAGWESTGAYIERQFNPTYSVSRPLDRPVLDARIVRGRGWGTPCRHAERGCRTVQLTLRGVVRGNPVSSSRATHDAPAPDEQAWMSYAPDPHLEQFRLRDAVGNQVPAFTRIEARRLAAGTDSVLSVASAAGREGRDEAIRFTVRMVPAATSRGHRRLRDPRGDRDGQRRLHPRLRHARLRARADGEDHRRAHRERHGEGQRRDLHADARQPVGRASRRRRGAGDDLERRNPERNVRRTPRQPRRHHRVHVQPRVQRRDHGEREHTQGQRAQRRRRHRHRSRADGRGEHPALERDGRALGRRRRDHRHRGDAELRGDRSDLHLRRSRVRGADASHRALHDRHRRDRRRPAGRQDARSEPLARTRRHRDLAVAARRRGDRRGGRVRLHAGGGGRGRAACGAGRARRRGGDQRGDGPGVAGAGQSAAWRRRGGAAVGGADAGVAAIQGLARRLWPDGRPVVRRDGRDLVRGRGHELQDRATVRRGGRLVHAGNRFETARDGKTGRVLERIPDHGAREDGAGWTARRTNPAAGERILALHGRLVGRGPGGGVAAPDAGGGPGDRRGGDLGPRRQRDLGRGRACRGASAVQRAGDGDGAGGRGADARHRARRHAARGGVYRRLGHGHALVPLHDRRGGRGGRGREAGPDRGGRALAQRRGDRGRRGTRGRARLLRRPLGGGGGG